jgi:hypothetical protein
MSVPSSGLISLSKIFREIRFCEFIGTNNVGGYYSNGAITGPISLAGLDSDSSVRAGADNTGDSTAPYGMSEWRGYNDWVPNTIYYTIEHAIGVPENPTYTIQVQTARGTKTTTVSGIGSFDGTSLLGTDDYVNIIVSRTSPDSTVQDAAEITWFSRVDPCDSGTQTQDQAETFTNGQSITNRSYNYDLIEEAAYFRVVIIEG